jgi:uncharacterized protein DUF2459
MHSIGALRKRFFTIFVIKRNPLERRPVLSQQVAIRRSLKRLRKRGIIWMQIRRNKPRQCRWRGLTQVAVLAVPLLFVACTAHTASLPSPKSGQLARTVYVVHHGTLHTGLTVNRADIPRGTWPANRDYSGSKYIEVGWGDDDGYRKPLTSGIAMKALAGSRRTVLLADGFSHAIRAKYNDPKFTVLAVDLSEAGFARLCEHIQQTYALNEKGAPIRLSEGSYRARGTYSAFNTCNTWVASGLRKAGCPITPTLCLMPGQLLGRVRPFARVVSTSR